MKKYRTVDEYIAAASPTAKTMLRQLRHTIRQAAPEAEEKMSYGMPYYGYHGRLAYFGSFRDHVSYFAMTSKKINAKFGERMKKYRTGKATLQFPLGSRIPLGLISSLVKARVVENKNKSKR